MIELMVSTFFRKLPSLSHFHMLLTGHTGSMGVMGMGGGVHTDDWVQWIRKAPEQILWRFLSGLAGGGSPNVFCTRRKPTLGVLLFRYDGQNGWTQPWLCSLSTCSLFCSFDLQSIFPESDVFSCLHHPCLLWACAFQICLWGDSPYKIYELLNSASSMSNQDF